MNIFGTFSVSLVFSKTGLHSAASHIRPVGHPPHLLPGPHNLVHEQKLRRQHRRQVQTLPLHPDVIPNSLVRRDHRLAGRAIQSHRQRPVAILPRIGQFEYAILNVESRIFREDLGNDHERLRVRLDAELRPSLGGLRDVVFEVHRRRELERSGARDDGLVLDGVLRRAESVANGVLDLIDGVHVRSLQEERAALGMPALLHERELVVSQRHLAHLPRPPELGGVEVLHGMDGRSSARERQPFHVPTLRPAQTEYPLLSEYVQRQRIDALLVDHHEALPLLAHRSLEIHHLPAPFVEPLPLALHELLPLLGRGVEESALDLRLLVLEGDVARHDVAVGQDLGHVGVPPPVIQYEAVDEARVGPHLATHRHDLDHVQVHGRLRDVLRHDAPDRVDDGIGDLLGEVVLELRLERRRRQAPQEVAIVLDPPAGVVGGAIDLELVEELDRGVARDVESLGDDARMQALGGVPLGLFEELAAEEDRGGRSVSRYLVLSSRRPRDQRGSGMLDLHLVKQNVAVLRQFDLAGPSHEHLERAAGAEVGFEHVLKAGCRRDVYGEGGALGDYLGVRGELLETG
mmetsp:Transcript_4838/g.12157  ORF Transcript_4838/g.12157 Transcript_4838/m.12157 type:complete len:574 (-) Transcript_4838:48-1769(-)